MTSAYFLITIGLLSFFPALICGINGYRELYIRRLEEEEDHMTPIVKDIQECKRRIKVLEDKE
jgi:hypothetical protein